jgi:hypothetical protein
MHDFRTAIRTHCGDYWLDTWWSTVSPKEPTLDSENGWVLGSLKPSSFVEFAMQVELFTFSEGEISHEISRNPEVPRSPKLLYYMLVGNACSRWEHAPFIYHSPKTWQDFARFLLRNGFDPNMALEVAVGPDRDKLMNTFDKDDEIRSRKSDEEIDKEDGNEDGDEDGNEDDNEDDNEDGNEDGDEDGNEDGDEDGNEDGDEAGDEDGNEEDNAEGNAEDNEDEHDIISESRDLGAPENRPQITIMHLALAIACTSVSDYLNSSQVIYRLDMLRILVEGGGNANVLNYRNYWSHRKGDATERSAIHYLLSSRHDGDKPFHSSEPEADRALSQCITAFLNHGADPNAVDSNGVSILELALPVCPYALVELMLEKGAQITPKLLSGSGVPLDHADGILDELRWRRLECYTPEARVIASKYNTHWAELEEEKRHPEQERVLGQDTGNILNTVGGYLGNLAGSMKRWL